MAPDHDINLDTDRIKNWRSIVTLIVFILANIAVLFPFHIPIYVPRILSKAVLDTLVALRILPSGQNRPQDSYSNHRNDKGKLLFMRLNFPINYVTAPLIADLFLLAILAIGRQEVHDGIIGANNISPIDIMVFFLTLAYIAISIDASGLIRFLAFKVLQKGGQNGKRLFFYLYIFFFGLGSFIGNDPIILSGTAFLAYMTRASSNIIHPRAWIFTQFSVANIASAILVSSNPTNLVLARAFDIKFIVYTANMVVPVVITTIVLFPFLLYIIFANEALIPPSIKMHEISEEVKSKKPVNPNIPYARGSSEEDEVQINNDEKGKPLSLEEIMNPFLDKAGAAFGAIIMAATLITVLALNAASHSGGEHPVFWVALPAAFVMFCWDIAFGWIHRQETREIARKGRDGVRRVRNGRALREGPATQVNSEKDQQDATSTYEQPITPANLPEGQLQSGDGILSSDDEVQSQSRCPSNGAMGKLHNKHDLSHASNSSSHGLSGTPFGRASNAEKQTIPEGNLPKLAHQEEREPLTLVSLAGDSYRWSQETFPTVTAVISHMPFALVPFAFAMFILVQGLVTKGWVPVFAYGWDHWVNKTGTVGSIGGMGFISVILCNFTGTNIGTTILLSRIVQSWLAIHHQNGIPISDRTFSGTVYSMAIGVNFGAFSTAFSASLAGLLWRDILMKKHIRVRNLEFARVNIPIIAITMVVGCAVLVGEVYIIRDNSPYGL